MFFRSFVFILTFLHISQKCARMYQPFRKFCSYDIFCSLNFYNPIIFFPKVEILNISAIYKWYRYCYILIDYNLMFRLKSNSFLGMASASSCCQLFLFPQHLLRKYPSVVSALISWNDSIITIIIVKLAFSS